MKFFYSNNELTIAIRFYKNEIRVSLNNTIDIFNKIPKTYNIRSHPYNTDTRLGVLLAIVYSVLT